MMVEFLKVGWNSLVREGVVESTGWSKYIGKVALFPRECAWF